MTSDTAHGAGPVPPSGDAWVYGPNGVRMWGRYGAAGLAVVDTHGRMLLQHRATWSHHGGTWGIPGGARDAHETPMTAALREAAEELAVPADAVDVVATRVLDLGFWTYTTLIARTTREFTPQITDAESAGAEWVALDALEQRPLHPGFAASLPDVRTVCADRPIVVADMANVLATKPDGWWRDRRGATATLLRKLFELADFGVPAAQLGLPLAQVWPRWHLVLEGEARAAADALPDQERVTVERASAHGDDAIVAAVNRLRAEHPDAVIGLASADRELLARADAHPNDETDAQPGQVRTVSPGALRATLDALDPASSITDSTDQ